MTASLSHEERQRIDAWWRAANYLSVGQIYLLDNPLLRDPMPKLGYLCAYAKQLLRDKLIDHKEYIAEHGEDMPEIRGWSWPYHQADEEGAEGTGAPRANRRARVEPGAKPAEEIRTRR